MRTEVSVEVRIGVADSPRELVVSSGLTPDEVEALVADAVKGKSGVLTLVDQKGARFVVPAARVAYVEIGPQRLAQGRFRLRRLSTASSPDRQKGHPIGCPFRVFSGQFSAGQPTVNGGVEMPATR